MAWARLARTILGFAGALALAAEPGPGLVAADAAAAPAPTAAGGGDDDQSGSLLVLTMDESIALAKARRISRLEREISAIGRELGELPSGLNHQERAATIAMTAAEYEGWLLEDEQQELRARIEQLKVRITLLERLDEHQELLDRARMVMLQRAEAELDTDHLEVQDRKQQRREDLEDVRVLIAVRSALHERLRRVDQQVAALVASSLANLPGPASTQTAPAAPAPVDAAATPAAAPAPAPAPAAPGR